MLVMKQTSGITTMQTDEDRHTTTTSIPDATPDREDKDGEKESTSSTQGDDDTADTYSVLIDRDCIRDAWDIIRYRQHQLDFVQVILALLIASCLLPAGVHPWYYSVLLIIFIYGNIGY